MRILLLWVGLWAASTLGWGQEEGPLFPPLGRLELSLHLYPPRPLPCRVEIQSVDRSVAGVFTLIPPAPLRQVWPQGRYWLRVQAEGYAPQERWVEIHPHRVAWLRLWLVPSALNGLLTFLGIVLVGLLASLTLAGLYLLVPLERRAPRGERAMDWWVSLRGEPVRLGPWMGAAGLWFLLALLLWVWSPVLPIEPGWGGFLSALLAAWLTGGLYAVWSLQGSGVAWSLGLFLGAGAWDLLLFRGPAEAFSDLMTLAHGLLLLHWAWGAGSLLAFGARRPDYLFNAALVVALADIYSVYWGPTGHHAAARTVAFSLMTMPYPVPGSNMLHRSIGAGDFLFLALFLHGAARLGLDWRRNLGALWLAFALGLGAAAWSMAHWGKGVPALPFLSLAFLLANGRRLWPRRGDWRSTALTLLAALAFFLLLLGLGR